jgi:hypothetical protein
VCSFGLQHRDLALLLDQFVVTGSCFRHCKQAIQIMAD